METSSPLQTVFRERNAEYCIMFSNQKNNSLNYRDYNIDQSNRDYDCFHNLAALPGWWGGDAGGAAAGGQ